MFLKNSWISTNEFIQLYCFYEENIMFLKTAQQSNAVSLIFNYRQIQLNILINTKKIKELSFGGIEPSTKNAQYYKVN